MDDVLAAHSLVLAPTEFSATAPLKIAAPKHGLSAATMPGFLPSMIPALRLDYSEINRRCEVLKDLLDRAERARFVFVVDGTDHHDLTLDLRYRTAHASGGLIRERGKAGNLPSGETYIVPYEGEHPGVPSRSEGTLPVQFEDEVVVYRIVENRAVEVLDADRGGRAATSHSAAASTSAARSDRRTSRPRTRWCTSTGCTCRCCSPGWRCARSFWTCPARRSS